MLGVQDLALQTGKLCSWLPGEGRPSPGVARQSLVGVPSLAVKHDWEKMTEAVQNHIGSLNWGYRVALREKKVVYENAYGQFIGPHRIKVGLGPLQVFPCCFWTLVPAGGKTVFGSVKAVTQTGW